MRLLFATLLFINSSSILADDNLKAILALQQAQIQYLQQMIQPNCNDGKPTQDKKYCFKRFSFPTNFMEADAACIAWGGRLASILNADENAILASISPGQEWVWIGLTDSGMKGTYRWVDGSPFSFQNFSPGEPNHAGDLEFCSVSGHGGAGRWNDINCAYPASNFVCKKSLTRKT